MDKKTAWILGIVAVIIVILLVRQNRTTEAPATTTATKSASPVIDSVKMEDKTVDTSNVNEEPVVEVTTVSTGLTLSGEAIGDGKIKFTWTAPEGLTEANRFIIVRDQLQNPEHTGNNYWFRQSHLKREVVLPNNPTGTFHYRLCLTANNQNDACTVYSNDVTVETK